MDDADYETATYLVKPKNSLTLFGAHKLSAKLDADQQLGDASPCVRLFFQSLLPIDSDKRPLVSTLWRFCVFFAGAAFLRGIVGVANLEV